MIDRYSVTASADQIQQRFQADVLPGYLPRYNAAPTQLLPVITQSGAEGVSVFYWGTSPVWSKNKPLSEKIINVRTESIGEKPSLRKTLAKNRCLIPADGFYAWKKVGKRTSIPFRFVVGDQDLFAIAGLWEEFEDTDGHELHTFTVITTLANQVVASVQDRMPAILTPASEKLWMAAESDVPSLLEILIPYEGSMNHYPVSPQIADSSRNFPSLVMPTPPADQFGNLTLFD
jgi:putative SOS response-associated peptidase YedK